jgi:hypothetical protein
MPTAQLQRLLIKEVSAVDAPANLSDGWLVLKAERHLGAAVTGEAAPATGLQVVWGEDGSYALTHPDADQVIVVKGGVSRTITKQGITGNVPVSTPAEQETGSSFPVSAPAEKQHHSHSQARTLDGTGRFRASVFRRATGKPKLTNATFFR